MLIQQKSGNIRSYLLGKRQLDVLFPQWYETSKRMLHKATQTGTSVTLKFLKEDPGFIEGDIIFENETAVIMIDILPSEAIVVKPKTMQTMASLCYEIGNKHLPIFITGDEVLIPYEEPLYKWLQVTGFEPLKEWRKLSNPLKTTTMAHAHLNTGSSLFSKIMQLTKNTTPGE